MLGLKTPESVEKELLGKYLFLSLSFEIFGMIALPLRSNPQ
jgi:hypothetical protein